MKVIIAGGRYFDDYDLLKEKCDKILCNLEEVVVVSGRCDIGTTTFVDIHGKEVCGADGLGERYAKENNHKIVFFPADWNALGKKAGPIRNKQMVEYADCLICFWDGKSKGAKNVIETAKKAKLKVRIVKY